MPCGSALTSSSLSIWYSRHMLQWRIGIFYGGATIAGVLSLVHSSNTQSHLSRRSVLRSPCLCDFFHERYARIGGLVMDFCEPGQTIVLRHNHADTPHRSLKASPPWSLVSYHTSVCISNILRFLLTAFVHSFGRLSRYRTFSDARGACLRTLEKE